MATGRNILIFHSGALGDFVLTWPLALALGRLHPQSRLFYVTHAGKGALAEKVLRLESADAEAGWHALYAEDAEPPEKASRLLAAAHSIVSFVGGPDDAWARNVHRLAPGANILPLTLAPPADYDGHVCDHLLAQLRPWPAAHAAAGQILRSIAARGVPVPRPPNADAVIIHPGSGSPRKCWPAARFAELAERLAGAGKTVRVLLGEVELETWKPAEIDRLFASAQVRRPGTYVQLLEELSGAGVFVGNDSGPGHLAGIIGVPTLSLFGPTDPRRWRPLGPGVEVLSGDPMEGIPVGDVYARVAALIDSGRA